MKEYDEFFYHFQEVFYWLLFLFFWMRFLINAIIHWKAQTYIYDLEENEGMALAGGRTSASHNRLKGMEKFFLYSFSFWWEIEQGDFYQLRRFKRFAEWR